MTLTRSTIMVVEDDDELNKAMTLLLRQNDFDVVSFHNGATALEELRCGLDVRAIVLDVTMPIMNGASFRGEQLADPALASIPLVLVTARTDLGPITAALQPHACLQKPVAADTLLRVLEQFR